MADDAALQHSDQTTTEIVDGPVKHSLQIEIVVWHRGSAQASLTINGYLNSVEQVLRHQLINAAMIVGQNIQGVGLTTADVAAKINSKVRYVPVDDSELAEQLASQAAAEHAAAQRHDQEIADALRAAGKLS